MRRPSKLQRLPLAFATFAVICASIHMAAAAEKLVVAKSVASAWTFIAIDVGEEIGVWTKNGLELNVTALGGGAKLAQALTSGSIDIGLAGGPVLGFMAKGVPAKGIAVFADQPNSMSVVVPYGSPIKTVQDLKGKRMGVTTVGSLTSWMTQRLSLSQGWGSSGIAVVPIGGNGTDSDVAALKLGQIDAIVIAPEIGFQLEKGKEARILVNANTFVKDFITHIMFARDQLIAERPQAIEHFLQGWFQTIAYMRTHKAETDKIAARVLRQDEDVMSKAYDLEMPEMSVDGSFKPEAVKVVKESLVDMQILPSEPSDDAIFTTRFVPVKF